jgi:hypothetical protein
LQGWLGFVGMLPYLLRQRQQILKHKRLTHAELDGLLSDELGEIPLAELLRGKVRSLLRR